jgi:TolB-like protein
MSAADRNRSIHSAGKPSPKETGKTVRQQLDRMLASPTFQQVDRLKRFLSFIVTETIAGRGDQLKEYVVGVQVFGKETSFDPRTDPIVRVQARRLRARMARYYRAEGQADETIIDLPKGGYLPVFKRREGGGTARRFISAASASRNAVAVMPFSDHSSNAGLEYVCKGVRQEIIHGLAKVAALRVIAWDPADLMPEGENAETGRTLAAAMIVTGSVQSSGERLRVTTQLVDAASGRYWWSESFDGHAQDIFALQERVAETVIAKLRPELLESATAAVPRRPTENLAAHNLYLQGRYHLNQRTEEGLQKAVDFFEEGDRRGMPNTRWLTRGPGALPSACSPTTGAGAGAGVGQVCLPAGGHGRDAGRPVRGGPHLARPREIDAGLGLAGRGEGVPARDQPGPPLSDRASLVRDVVPGPHGAARRGARSDAARAVARPRVRHHRPRPHDGPLLPPRLRGGPRPVRPHHRAQPALLARLLDARPDP